MDDEPFPPDLPQDHRPSRECGWLLLRRSGELAKVERDYRRAIEVLNMYVGRADSQVWRALARGPHALEEGVERSTNPFLARHARWIRRER